MICEVLAVQYAAAGLLMQLQALLRANEFLRRYQCVGTGTVGELGLQKSCDRLECWSGWVSAPCHPKCPRAFNRTSYTRSAGR